MAQPESTPATSLETHYTPQQIADAWSLSVDSVRALFRDEPGVLVIDRPETLHKRGYRSVRIPQSVMLRVRRRLSTN